MTSGPGQLQQLQLLLTERCNLTCSHCAVPEEESPAGFELTTADWTSFITTVLERGVRRIVLSGGEALLRKDCLEVAEHALVSGAEAVVLVSNGTVLQRSSAEPLAALQGRWPNFLLHISVDGASPATHDLIRGAGTFQRVLAGVGRLRAAGGSVTGVHTVLSTANVTELDGLVALVTAWEARTWTLFPIAALGRGRDLDALRLGEDAWREILDFLGTDPLPGVDIGLMGPTLGDEWYSTDMVPATRAAYSPQACVGPDGEVFTCPPLRHRSAGRVREVALDLDWDSVDRALRETIETHCPSCAFQPLCTGVDVDRGLVTRKDPFVRPGPVPLRMIVEPARKGGPR